MPEVSKISGFVGLDRTIVRTPKRVTPFIAGLAFSISSLICVAAGPLTLSGELSTAGSSYSLADLQGLGSTAQSAGGHSYVGVPLWSFLNGTAQTSNILTTGGGNNAILRSYVVATGADGRQSYLSIGEINPLFGGAVNPYLVAYQRDGAALSSPLLVVSDDPTGTRNVSDLANLSVQSVVRPPVGPGGVSTSFALSGVANPGTYNLPALQAPPNTTVQGVEFFNGSTSSGLHDYTGDALWGLLTSAGISGYDPLTSYVLATGSDGYEVLFTLAELNPAFGAAQNLVAYQVDGVLYDTAAGSGFARIVVPGDLRGGRYVSNLTSLQVVAVPEPSMAVMLLLGLGAILLWRKRRPTLRVNPQGHGPHNVC